VSTDPSLHVPSLRVSSTGAGSTRGHSEDRVRLGRFAVTADAVIGLGLAGGLAAVAFLTTGGDSLGPNTWTEIVLTIIGAGLAVAVLLLGASERAWGAVTVGMFALLAALTAASIAWSVQPNNSWIEAGRTLSYLAVFGGGAALARLLPGRWAAVLGAIAVATAVIGGYALLVKVFPATLDPNDQFGRLQAPFQYWNATGLIGALGLAPCLWAGARRERARALRALAVPAVSILLTVTVLSYSRGALLVALIGLICWFATVPLRLRGALVLILGALGAAVLTIFALKTPSLTDNQVALHSRTTAGHAFGILLVVVLVLATVAGLIAAYAMDRITLGERVRRRVATALLVGVALIPVFGVVALAASSRGLTGEVSHVFSSLTSTSGGASNTPARLVELGNSRARYWSEGVKVGEHALLKGVGALGYETAVTRYTDYVNDVSVVPHAHSFVIETFADFGLIGVAVMVALLTAWIVAARRTLKRPESHWHPGEQAGLLTMLAVVITFGAHSAIDWTWFVPGTAIPALLCAGWLAGRGPSADGVGLAAQRRRLVDSPGIGAAALAIAAATLLCAWAIWQPLRSENANNAAIAAFSAGNTSVAFDDARTAAAQDPLTVDPLFQLAAMDTATGNRRAAQGELLRAISRQPENAQTWLQLGDFYLQENRPGSALGPLRRAKQLDRGSIGVSDAFAQLHAESAR
jgi:O-Antigen ligase